MNKPFGLFTLIAGVILILLSFRFDLLHAVIDILIDLSHAITSGVLLAAGIILIRIGYRNLR